MTFFPASLNIVLVIVSLLVAVNWMKPCSAQPTNCTLRNVDMETDPSTSRFNLNFIFLSSNNPRLRSSGSIPAVDIALEMVADSGILGNYTLRYTAALDSQCDRTRALDEFYGVVEAREEDFVQNIAVIGAGCSVATLPIAEICHYYNMPIISWTSAAAELSIRTKYRSSYRLPPSERIYSPGLAALLHHFAWRQLVIITQLESLFISTQRVVTELLSRDVNIVTREFATHSHPLDMDDLFVEDLDMRVFVLNMYVDHARHIICEASKKEMFYPRFLWITPGWYGVRWWEFEVPDDCTVDDMERALSYSLLVVQYPVYSETEISELGLSTEHFRNLYGQRLYEEAAFCGNMYAVDLTAPLAFEAVWTLAKAIKMTRDKIANGSEGRCGGLEGDLVPLEEFDYGNQKLGCLLQESLDQLHFLGISGNVEFDESGDRVGNTVRISQYIPVAGINGRVSIDTPLRGYGLFAGTLDNITDLSVEFIDNSTTLWPKGKPPDGIPKHVVESSAAPLTANYYLLSIAGILFAL